jgi:16S rRNA (guanine527-N7)-methyltransferase
MKNISDRNDNCQLSIVNYFPDLSPLQKEQINKLYSLYENWNLQINVISRKDFSNFYERHVLHSLGIAKVIQFKAGTKVMDVGTGGGFPGIPLAILFPDVQFTLVDSIGKKIKVVNEITNGIDLKNVNAIHQRGEDIDSKFHFIVTRAVGDMNEFYRWVKLKFEPDSFNDLPNGILALKGGDLKEELSFYSYKAKIFDLNNYFKEEFFETKKVVYIPVK